MNRRAPIIAGVAFAVVAVLAVMFLVLPKMREVSSTQEQLAEAETIQSGLRNQLASLREAEAQAPEVRRQIAQLANQVPPTVDLPALLRLLTQAADGSAVDFLTVSPQNPIADASGQFSTVPASISVTGGYFALDEFLFRLETLPRAAKVLSISVSPGGATPITATGAVNLSMQLSVDFYTTDTSAGPGSQPGPTETIAGA